MSPRRLPARKPIKVSTMPRRQSEADQYLDLYKLTIEKTRLQNELQDLEARAQNIRGRLAEIEVDTQQLKTGQAAKLPASTAMPLDRPQATVVSPQVAAEENGGFEMMVLEY
jgi:hypothetical protein